MEEKTWNLQKQTDNFSVNNNYNWEILTALNNKNNMNEETKQKLQKLINTLTKIYNEKNTQKISRSQVNEIIENLSKLDKETIMDSLILKIIKRINGWELTHDEVLSNIELLFNIDPENYKNVNDIINRYNYLKEIWLDKVPITKNTNEILKENHNNVIEVFDNFNKLIEELSIDYFYTWGLVWYFWTNTELERYHWDIDICLNVDDLEKVKTFLQENKNSWFKFIDNLKNKWEHGHEYMIQYWDNPILIGLFLFKKSDKISRVEYDLKKNWRIIETESPMDSTEIEDWKFNNTSYKRQSLKSIYDSKKDSSRPKDKHDVKILEEYFSKE